MTIAILFDNAKLPKPPPGRAGSVAVTQLLEHGRITIQPLKQGVEKQAIGDSGVFFGVGALDSDGELTGKLGIGTQQRCSSRQARKQRQRRRRF